MPPLETDPAVPGADERPTPGCRRCLSALRSPGRGSVAFLLLDTLTVPLVGCNEHLERFRSVCGHTTAARAELIDHRPAGGITCPGCRLAAHNPRQAVVPVEDGAVAVLACSEHGSKTVRRFGTGLRTRRTLDASLPTSE